MRGQGRSVAEPPPLLPPRALSAYIMGVCLHNSLGKNVSTLMLDSRQFLRSSIIIVTVEVHAKVFTMADQPAIAGTSPLHIEVEEGKSYWWCACGKSNNQPFCDGSHKGSSFVPVNWTASKTGKVFFCNCKQTKRSPLCDGTHNALK